MHFYDQGFLSDAESDDFTMMQYKVYYIIH